MNALSIVSPRAPYVVFFDGHCAFCRAQAARLTRFSSPSAPVVVQDFQQPGALDAYPSLSHEACMVRMHMVAPDGRIFTNAEAVTRLLMTRAWGMVFAWLYFVPGLRQIADAAYAQLARRRYRLAKARRVIHCDGTTCSAHFE